MRERRTLHSLHDTYIKQLIMVFCCNTQQEHKQEFMAVEKQAE